MRAERHQLLKKKRLINSKKKKREKKSWLPCTMQQLITGAPSARIDSHRASAVNKPWNYLLNIRLWLNVYPAWRAWVSEGGLKRSGLSCASPPSFIARVAYRRYQSLEHGRSRIARPKRMRVGPPAWLWPDGLWVNDRHRGGCWSIEIRRGSTN